MPFDLPSLIMSYTSVSSGSSLLRSGRHPSRSSIRSRVSSIWVQHGEGEEVDLGEVGVGDAVLVPVHDEATVDGPGADGDHLRDGRVAEDHAADVLAQASGRVHQLGGKLDEVTPARGLHAVAEGGQAEHLVAEVGCILGVELLREQPQVVLRQANALPRSWMTPFTE